MDTYFFQVTGSRLFKVPVPSAFCSLFSLSMKTRKLLTIVFISVILYNKYGNLIYETGVHMTFMFCVWDYNNKKITLWNAGPFVVSVSEMLVKLLTFFLVLFFVFFKSVTYLAI